MVHFAVGPHTNRTIEVCSSSNKGPQMFSRRSQTLSTWTLLATLFLPSTGLGQQEALVDGEVLTRFVHQMGDQVREEGVGGITAGIVVGTQLVWAQGFGWADMEHNVPAGVNTVYRVGSISKSFTGVALLQLWEKGMLELSDPVIGVLPEFGQLPGPDESTNGITFLHLATHTAGLNREPGLEGAASGPIEDWEEKLLASIPTTGVLAEPGEVYSYSNIGFGILGYALSRVAGAPYMELIGGAVLRPMEMTSSGFVVTPEIAEKLAVGYQWVEGGTVDRDQPAREHVGRGYKIPNGGIYSTVGDLARYMAGIMGASSTPILGPESISLLRTVHTPEGSEQPYGIGFKIWESPGGSRLVGHTGSVSGYTAFMAFEPESQIGVILLGNYHPGRDHLSEPGLGLLGELVDALHH